MSKPKRPPWVERDDDIAVCLICGAVSEWFLLLDWRPSLTGRPRHFTHWHWWRRFKQTHRRCIERDMSWQDLIPTEADERAFPWLGGRTLMRETGQRWTVVGKLPPEQGWHKFRLQGRKAHWLGECEADSQVLGKRTQGYLVGDRFVPDYARVETDVEKLAEFEVIHLLERGLERFSRVTVARPFERGPLVYVDQAFPLGPEDAVLQAFQDQKDSLDGIPEVVPALDAAFRFERHQRAEVERRRAEAAERRRQEELREQARKTHGAAHIREVATQDFSLAARAALAVGGAEYLDHRDSYEKGEYVVQFKVENRRFECVCDQRLQIVDAGICLTDHGTGQKGDTWLTLESFPGVIRQAIRERRLVVWRHVDRDYDDEDWD